MGNKKEVNIGGLNLPFNNAQKEQKLVHTTDNFIISSANNLVLRGIVSSILIQKPVLLVGETGIGKTALIKYLAGITNNVYRRIQINGNTGVDTMVGKWLINEKGTYWVNGILTDAMIKGHWLLLDEINTANPEILFVLNSVLDDDGVLILDDKGQEIVKPHPNFKLFAAMNPWQEYAGTKEMNKAQLDRFSVIEVGYPTAKAELKIIKQHLQNIDVDKKDENDNQTYLERFVQFANNIRKLHQKNELLFSVSTRQLIHWGKLCEFLPIKTAALFSIISKSDIQEERQLLQDELNKLFRNTSSFLTSDTAKKAPKLDAGSEQDKNVDIDSIIDVELLKATRIATGANA